MKPKANDVLGNDREISPVETKGEFYVQFSDEPLHVAIAAHDDEPFKSIEECMEFATESGEDIGTTFNIVDIDGKIHKSGIITHEGAEETELDSIRG